MKCLIKQAHCMLDIPACCDEFGQLGIGLSGLRLYTVPKVDILLLQRTNGICPSFTKNQRFFYKEPTATVVNPILAQLTQLP